VQKTDAPADARKVRAPILPPCDIEVFLTTRNITRLALVCLLVTVCAGCSSSDTLSPTASSTTGGAISDFQGQYTGTYRVDTCVEEGFFAGFCEGTGLVAGATPPISLTLTQNQGAVSGNVLLGQITGTFLGTVSGSTLTGTAVMTDITEQDGTLSTKISTWKTTLSSSGMSGGFTIVFSVPGQNGNATLTNTIVRLTH
jgi:hypothetical protein